MMICWYSNQRASSGGLVMYNNVQLCGAQVPVLHSCTDMQRSIASCSALLDTQMPEASMAAQHTRMHPLLHAS
jgi:hypothetical protein